MAHELQAKSVHVAARLLQMVHTCYMYSVHVCMWMIFVLVSIDVTLYIEPTCMYMYMYTCHLSYMYSMHL